MSTTRAAIDQLQDRTDALLAEHTSRLGVSDFSRYRDDPVGFLTEVLRTPVGWDRLADVAGQVRDHPLVAVKGANGTGKDWLSARLALWWVYGRGGTVLVTGPTARQVEEVCMGEVARAFARTEDLPGQLFQTALRIPGSAHAGIVAVTTTNSSRFTGYHAPSLLVVITEAQGVESFVWEGVLSNAISDDTRVLAVGNPLFGSGTFFDVFHRSGWATATLSALEHPNVTTRATVIPGAVTVAGIERLREMFGESSAQFRARVLAEFPEAGSAESLVRRGWVEQAFRRYPEWSSHGRSMRAEPILGVDIAREGGDASIVAPKFGRLIEPLVPLPQGDTMQTVEEILRAAQTLRVALRPDDHRWTDFPLATARIDEIGVGYGVCDRLRELGARVDPFNSSRTPQYLDRELFLNRRAEAFWGLRALLEAGELAIARDPLLLEELCALTWGTDAQGKIKIVAKDELRVLLHRSPDRADAVAMACHGSYHPAGQRWVPFRIRY